MSIRKKPWPDVPRLLLMRNRFENLQPGVASSVTAFLAWKAFLITAKSVGTGSERDRCIGRLVDAVDAQRECAIAAGKFAAGLEALAEQSSTALADWLAADDDEPRVRDGKVGHFKRVVSGFSQRHNDLLPQVDRRDVAEYAVALRHSVIAHGSVHSTASLFGYVVPRFESFVAAVAWQGYAAKLGVSFQEVISDCAIERT